MSELEQPPYSERLWCKLTGGHKWDSENARCTKCKAWNPRLEEKIQEYRVD